MISKQNPKLNQKIKSFFQNKEAGFKFSKTILSKSDFDRDGKLAQKLTQQEKTAQYSNTTNNWNIGRVFKRSLLTKNVFKKSLALITIITVIITTYLQFTPQTQAATYTLFQTDWSGGESATETHSGASQTEIDTYSAKDANTAVNGSVTLSTTAGTPITQTNNGDTAIGFNQTGVDYDSGKIVLNPAATTGPGVDASVELALSGGIACGGNIVAGGITYSTALFDFGGTTGIKCMITRNLGATAQATSATDSNAAAAGSYYQFGKATPGWQSGWTYGTEWAQATDPCYRVNSSEHQKLNDCEP